MCLLACLLSHLSARPVSLSESLTVMVIGFNSRQMLILSASRQPPSLPLGVSSTCTATAPPLHRHCTATLLFLWGRLELQNSVCIDCSTCTASTATRLSYQPATTFLASSSLPALSLSLSLLYFQNIVKSGGAAGAVKKESPRQKEEGSNRARGGSGCTATRK